MNRLACALVRQIDIDPPGKKVRCIPLALTMTQQHQRRHASEGTEGRRCRHGWPGTKYRWRMVEPEHVHPTAYGNAVSTPLRELGRELRRAIPDVYKGLSTLATAAFSEGELDRKAKELIALSIAVSTRCDGCIAAHARGAARAGATEGEVAETLGVCIQMMGGPGTVYAPRAFAAYREFASEMTLGREDASVD